MSMVLLDPSPMISIRSIEVQVNGPPGPEGKWGEGEVREEESEER